MGRLIVANRRGHQVLEWPDTDTEEARPVSYTHLTLPTIYSV